MSFINLEHGSLFMRVSTALFYGTSSFAIMVVNKHVLTVHAFPSFCILGVGQMAATVLLLSVARLCGFITLPRFEPSILRKMWPLPAIYVANLVTGLASTKALSLPMMTVLRRFSIWMTMVGEYIFLSIRPSPAVQVTVYGMVGGAAIAALNDLSFDLVGYAFVLANDLATAANGVVSKMKLEARELGKNAITYYNALFMIVPLALAAFFGGEFEKVLLFPKWADPAFLLAFLASCVMGTALMYSSVQCTAHNSALTTTVIGCLKNVLVSYYGIVFNTGDYTFTWNNFIGINISIVASLVFSYLSLTKRTGDTKSGSSILPTTVPTKDRAPLLQAAA